VASSCAGGAEVITEGVNGSVVRPTDTSAITSALERFRERSAAELTDAARRSAEPHTYAAQVEGLARVYARVTRATCDFP
jgi:glycosyltransferase involved in cell wall biosynthesis